MVHKVFVDGLNKYVRFPEDPRMSEFHKFLTQYAVEIILRNKTFLKHSRKVSITAVQDIQQDKAYYDVYTDFFYCEIETGLKHSYDDLKERLKKADKHVFVILPNQDIKGRYLKALTVGKRTFHLKICTVDEFTYELRVFLNNLFRDHRENSL